jgi:hypothetical protein
LTSAGFLRILNLPVNMNKTQFAALNIVGAVCSLLIIGEVVLGMLNNRLNKQVAQTQAQFNQAQQMHNTAQNLVVRMAQAGQTDPALRDLLARHDFKVNLNTNSPAPATP